MASIKAWRSRIIELATADLGGRSSEELCVVFAGEFIRVIEAIMWTLDDGRRRPLNFIKRRLSWLAGTVIRCMSVSPVALRLWQRTSGPAFG